MRSGLPIARPGQAVGLLGGSFDPPHAAHVHITRAALRHFGLGHIWWLVSPGNPLKENGPAPLDQRMQAARAIMDHPRVTITDIEAHLRTRHTAQTLRALQRRYPTTNFVWLMGADNLAQFHLWQDWRWIMQNIPIGVLARPGARMPARLSVAARTYRHARLADRASHRLANAAAPAWCFVNLPMSDQSSTAIRRGGGW